MADETQRDAAQRDAQDGVRLGNVRAYSARPAEANAPDAAAAAQETDGPVRQPTPAVTAGRANAVVHDETYGELREENRVVMRHQIALNIDNFRASTDDFVARPQRSYAPLKPATAPFFSVIVPNYNGAALLPPLFDALGAQDFGDFELIVVDDASSDESVAWVETHAPDARVIVNRQNAGFVASCNLAAAAARGRFIVLLNNDTEPEPQWLTELARAVCAHPNAAIVTSKLLLHEKPGVIHSTGDLMGVDGVPRNRGVWEADRGQFDGDTQVFAGCGAASAIRRDVWQALGGFDEDFWMYLEDVDFGFRAQLMGLDVIFAPAARVHHRLSSSGGDELSSFYVGRNTLWTLVKNMPTTLLRRHAFDVLRAQITVTTQAIANVRGKAAQQRLRGQLAGLRGLPRQLRKRRVIQARRRAADEALAQRLVH